MREPDVTRRTPAALALIVLLSVALRVAAALYLGNVVTPEPGIFDQVSYHTLATRVLDGHGFTFGTGWWPATPANQPTAHWSYLYVLFLAGVYAVAGVNPIVARLLQAVAVGVLHPLLTYRLGLRLFGRVPALVGSAAVACYAYYVYYSGALMTESFFILATIYSLVVALEIGDAAQKDVRPPSALAWARLGVGLAAAVLLRQMMLLVAPVILLWTVWRTGRTGPGARRAAMRGCATAGLVIALSIVPWTVRNYRAFGRFVPLNTNAGFALYWGNHPIHGDRFVPLLPGDYSKLIPADLKGLDEAALDSALMRRAIALIAHDPIRFVVLSVTRVPEFVKFWPAPGSSAVSNYARPLSFGLSLPFVLWGIVLSLVGGRSERPGRRSPDFAGVWLVLCVALTYSLLYLGSWTLVRYRVPVDAMLAPFLGLSIAWLFAGRRWALFSAPLGGSQRAEV